MNTFFNLPEIRISFLMLALLFTTDALAAGRFEFTPKAKDAYDKVISLRFDEARRLISQIKYEDPDNLIIYHIENYIDFFSVFINEDKKEFRRLEKNKDYRLKQLKKGDSDSPYYLYTQAEVRLQWALARLKFEEYFTAFNEVKTAYKQLNKNSKKFPDFVANKKSMGILHAIVGTVPDNYKWGVKLLGGMDGTIEEGRNEIEEVLKYAKHNDFIFEEETLVMYAFLLLHLKNQDDEAWTSIHSGKLVPEKNPLACFALANVAMRTGKNDEAIHLLKNRPKDPAYMPFPYLDYMLGAAKLNRMDADAEYYLKAYIRKFRGLNYIKQAYQKIAWHHLLIGNRSGYLENISKCKTFGETIIDGDKNALEEAESGQSPDIDLLKARVLFDGGYYKRAYQLLKQKSKSDYPSKHFNLEYTYRLGRVTHKMNNTDEAIAYYQQTIDNGRDESWFYACNAALQIGIIYEEDKQKEKARAYYKTCLSIDPDEYKNSLHQKAKAGLNRTGN
jgi:tetratricopeptide (TPR) repeat protein